jgi:uncharacterized membrane protein
MEDPFMTFPSSTSIPLFAADANPGLWANPIDGLVVSVAMILMAIGVAIIVWGAYGSVLRFIALETAAARGRAATPDLTPVRLLFAVYLLPGLDFLIAGGVIKTLAVSDWRQITVLGALVLIRALLGVSTRWEAGSTSAVASPALPDGIATKNGTHGPLREVACASKSLPEQATANKPEEALAAVNAPVAG